MRSGQNNYPRWSCPIQPIRLLWLTFINDHINVWLYADPHCPDRNQSTIPNDDQPFNEFSPPYVLYCFRSCTGSTIPCRKSIMVIIFREKLRWVICKVSSGMKSSHAMGKCDYDSMNYKYCYCTYWNRKSEFWMFLLLQALILSWWTQSAQFRLILTCSLYRSVQNVRMQPH